MSAAEKWAEGKGNHGGRRSRRTKVKVKVGVGTFHAPRCALPVPKYIRLQRHHAPRGSTARTQHNEAKR
jgi:hypothetical protein